MLPQLYSLKILGLSRKPMNFISIDLNNFTKSAVNNKSHKNANDSNWLNYCFTAHQHEGHYRQSTVSYFNRLPSSCLSSQAGRPWAFILSQDPHCDSTNIQTRLPCCEKVSTHHIYRTDGWASTNVSQQLIIHTCSLLKTTVQQARIVWKFSDTRRKMAFLSRVTVAR